MFSPKILLAFIALLPAAVTSDSYYGKKGGYKGDTYSDPPGYYYYPAHPYGGGGYAPPSNPYGGGGYPPAYPEPVHKCPLITTMKGMYTSCEVCMASTFITGCYHLPTTVPVGPTGEGTIDQTLVMEELDQETGYIKMLRKLEVPFSMRVDIELIGLVHDDCTFTLIERNQTSTMDGHFEDGKMVFKQKQPGEGDLSLVQKATCHLTTPYY